MSAPASPDRWDANNEGYPAPDSPDEVLYHQPSSPGNNDETAANYSEQPESPRPPDSPDGGNDYTRTSNEEETRGSGEMDESADGRDHQEEENAVEEQKEPEEESRQSDGEEEKQEEERVAGSDADSDDELNISKRRVIDSDDEQEETTSPSKRKIAISSDEDSDNEDRGQKKRGNLLGSDQSDVSDNEGGDKRRGSEDVGELMANIFGEDSDEEQEEEREKPAEEEEEVKQERDEEEEDEGPTDRQHKNREDLTDFDDMMRRKKAERKRQRKRRGGDGIDIINDDDGRIAAMVEAMKKATNEDRIANENRKPALKKRKMLPEVKMMLLRSEMFEALIENGMMSAVSDWLSPLPDKSLPALEIRTDLLKLLQNFIRLEQGVLRQSGLGKAVMMLFKHPKETKQNKDLAANLIREWSRPIFQLDTDMRSVTREERESRDQDRMPEAKRRRLSQEVAGPSSKKDPQDLVLRPGDPGYINRARVPRISTKDYVVRPRHQVEGEFKGERKGKAHDRLNKAQREFNERTKRMKVKRAVQVSLEGRNLAI